ncbi:unnamed protein product [Amoebophrya sp. A25]|nr:unnamed protein product [Amoebophrya sp. A25]|eukprot:GSA25T00025658001.1
MDFYRSSDGLLLKYYVSVFVEVHQQIGLSKDVAEVRQSARPPSKKEVYLLRLSVVDFHRSFASVSSLGIY